MINEKDLAIVIECDPLFIHSWMCFVSWYSIQKKIPDAEVFLQYSTRCNTFPWASRVGIRKFIRTDRKIVKKISPSVMAVRELSDNFDIVSSKTNISATFVDYKYGCGKFELNEWANKKIAPFSDAHKKFSTFDLTINEYAVLDIWEQCCIAYKELVGGSI
jgi:hypothetical protein